MSRVLDLWAGMTGTVLDFAGTTAPNGWMLCYGQAVSRATYPNLFAAIGTTFGAGDGSTTFNLPDARGRAAIGKDNMGGTAAGRVTTAGGGVDGATLGAVGGAQSHTLTAEQIPAHTHALNSRVGARGTATSPAMTPTTQVAEGTSAAEGGNVIPVPANTGGGGAHPNVQPGIVFNKIIKV